MKRVMVALGLMLCMAAPAFAVDFAFHGDLNNRARLATNQAGFFNGVDKSTSFARTARITDDSSNDLMFDYKYRLWTEASSDDGAIKGVFAIEIAEEYGSNGSTDFGGDGVDIMTRWAYVDFALFGGRAKLGLQPLSINKFFWEETATGLNYKIAAGSGDLELAWYRPYEVVNTDGGNDFEDLDGLYLRYTLKPADGTKVGFFGTWLHSDGKTATDTIAPAADITNWYLKTSYAAGTTANAGDLDLYTIGVDGGTKAGNFFANWDLMYQMGDYAEAYDFGGYFAHFDLGMKMGNGKLTYTFWYASGDDERGDSDYDAFMAVDVDLFESVVFFESFTDSDYFSATPYLQDKGMIFNRLSYDYQVSDKLKVGAAAIYMMTAEDLEYDTDDVNADLDAKDDEIGLEFDVYVKYQIFSKTEFAVEAGYLMTGDAMDFYEVECDGNADEDIWMIDTRLRYMF